MRPLVTALLLSFAACAAGTTDSDEQRRRPRVDAGARAVDASTSGIVGIVSCYRENAPGATCTLPTPCCFDNYSSQHNGACGAVCAWGTIRCDGPEDCAGGEHCCAHTISDPDQGFLGHTLACQAGACGPAPASQELCHTGTCPSGQTCVSAYLRDNDLPRSLSICQ